MKGPPVAHCQQCDASIEPGVLHQGSVFCGDCRFGRRAVAGPSGHRAVACQLPV